VSAMDCTQSRALMSPYIDGELAADRAAALERHLEGCAQCRAAYEIERRMSSAVRDQGERFKAPAHLKARIMSEIERNAQSGGWRDLRYFATGWNPAALAASIVLAAVLGSAATMQYLGGNSEEPLVQEVVAGQIRSLMADHLTDVASSDQHTVKPWFNGKLDFSPPVADFAADGFALAGGRLDYLDHRNVAALVYRHRQHVINVFIWPEAGELGPRLATRQGYNLVYFKRNGMEYWLVSDLNAGELKEFAQRLARASES